MLNHSRVCGMPCPVVRTGGPYPATSVASTPAFRLQCRCRRCWLRRRHRRVHPRHRHRHRCRLTTPPSRTPPPTWQTSTSPGRPSTTLRPCRTSRGCSCLSTFDSSWSSSTGSATTPVSPTCSGPTRSGRARPMSPSTRGGALIIRTCPVLPIVHWSTWLVDSPLNLYVIFACQVASAFTAYRILAFCPSVYHVHPAHRLVPISCCSPARVRWL